MPGQALSDGAARCASLVLADVVDVDHVQPLARGGEDTDGVVQPLCRECHLVKTGEDFGAAGDSS
ncbi:HNH endonuclease [Streptomyces sp. NBC_01224]|uniref:HNH endonuclease n=1 Tax=Streptomyces sp. NBC_01224 TaxID=2903783 RepID=UPI003FA34BB1